MKTEEGFILSCTKKLIIPKFILVFVFIFKFCSDGGLPINAVGMVSTIGYFQ